MSVSFFMFQYNKGHSVRAYLDTIQMTLVGTTIMMWRDEVKNSRDLVVLQWPQSDTITNITFPMMKRSSLAILFPM